MRALVSLGLRLLAVGGKFAVMLVLAREASAQEVGKFALFFGAINIFVYLIGLDFHLFTIRELIARRTLSGRLRIIFGQMIVDGSIYGLIILLALGAILTGAAKALPVSPFWFASILIGDHLTQELSRQFLVFRRPHLSNILYAIKTGLWGWAGSAAILAGAIPATVESFYALWLGADIIGAIVGLYALVHMMRGAKPSLPARTGKWVHRGLHVSKYFYFTSVATMCIAYLDRFLIAHQVTVSEAGKYAFWQSVASLLPVVVYAMAGMHYLPMLVEAYKRNRLGEFAQLARAFRWKTAAISAACGVGIVLVSLWIPALVGKVEFQASIPFVLVVVAAAALNALWQVPYQVLYSTGQDKWLAAVLTSLTLSSILLDLLLIPSFQIMGAAAASLVTNLAIYVLLHRRASRHQTAASNDGMGRRPRALMRDATPS